MNTVRELHNEASLLGQLAMTARDNDPQRATRLARRAYEFELKALALLSDDESAGITSSVLLLAAASLAYQCAEYKEALRLIVRGLAGCPPAIIYRDLLNLSGQIDARKEKQEIDEC